MYEAELSISKHAPTFLTMPPDLSVPHISWLLWFLVVASNFWLCFLSFLTVPPISDCPLHLSQCHQRSYCALQFVTMPLQFLMCLHLWLCSIITTINSSNIIFHVFLLSSFLKITCAKKLWERGKHFCFCLAAQKEQATECILAVAEPFGHPCHNTISI